MMCLSSCELYYVGNVSTAQYDPNMYPPIFDSHVSAEVLIEQYNCERNRGLIIMFMVVPTSAIAETISSSDAEKTP